MDKGKIENLPEGLLILTEGTEFDLEIHQNSTFDNRDSHLIRFPNQVLQEEILVGDCREYFSTESTDVLKKWSLSNSKILFLQEQSKIFEENMGTNIEIQNPYMEQIYRERNRLNSLFVQSLLGKDIERMKSVDIVLR